MSSNERSCAIAVKEEKIELEGEITEALRNRMFRVTLDNGHEMIGYTSGRMKRYRIRMNPGDRVLVECEGRLDRTHSYGHTTISSLDEASDVADWGDTRLTLVTCYPFDAVRAGGPLRYVVTALAIDAEHFRASGAVS